LKEDSDIKNKPSKKKNTYLQLSSVAIQMGVVITAFTFFGDYLDKHQENKTAVWTIVLSLTGVMISMYLIFKEIKKITDNEK
jgi:ATP synthase protein I